MAQYIALVTIKTGPNPEDSFPPGAVVEINDDDAPGLKGYIRAPKPGELGEIVSQEVESDDSGDGSDPEDGDPSEGQGEGENGSEGGESRVETIRAAIDLLDPEADFVKTGDRAGKPKIGPLSEALGFKPDDVEIEAALALRDEGV